MFIAASTSAGAASFNRTSLELKLTHLVASRQSRLAFNRTSLELKLSRQDGYQDSAVTFNRTSLELKRVTQYRALLDIFDF